MFADFVTLLSSRCCEITFRLGKNHHPTLPRPPPRGRCTGDPRLSRRLSIAFPAQPPPPLSQRRSKIQNHFNSISIRVNLFQNARNRQQWMKRINFCVQSNLCKIFRDVENSWKKLTKRIKFLYEYFTPIKTSKQLKWNAFLFKNLDGMRFLFKRSW